MSSSIVVNTHFCSFFHLLLINSLLIKYVPLAWFSPFNMCAHSDTSIAIENSKISKMQTLRHQRLSVYVSDWFNCHRPTHISEVEESTFLHQLSGLNLSPIMHWMQFLQSILFQWFAICSAHLFVYTHWVLLNCVYYTLCMTQMRYYSNCMSHTVVSCDCYKRINYNLVNNQQ